jgi:glycerol-3-phosphate acyltransferase PlsX
MRIAVDASGGEYAPKEIVTGVITAAEEYKVDITLVGNKSILHVLSNRQLRKSGLITITEASQTIELGESPIKAVQSKPDSSIVVGVNLVRDGTASAFVSAGNTGAVLCASLFNLEKIDGIERPALGSILALTPTNPVLLIDAGVNADCRPKFLVQFAQLGSIYMQHLLGIDSPRVGLLSNGEEENKGNRLTKESHRLLKKTNLNFVGNIEGQDMLNGKIDVIVTDGFTGNIVLKTMEGLGDTFLSSMRQVGHLLSCASHFQARTLIRDIRTSSWVKRMDYRESGGAYLLGINGNIVIAHGRSQSKAIMNAIGLAKLTVDRGITSIVKEKIHE